MSQTLGFLISGRVQGVGFRWWTRKQAQRLGILGWVRNLADGRVEVQATSSPELLEEFATLLQQGPPSGRVDRVEQKTLPAGNEVGFVIRS